MRASTPARPWHRLVGWLLLASLAGCSGTPPSTSPASTSPSRPRSLQSGRIVFSTFEDVYAVDVDGRGLRQLTHRRAHEFDASWSPDGRRIAYRSEADGQPPDIWVMNADGSSQTRIARGLSPAWSPDGAKIAYADAQGSLSVMNPDGSGQRQVPGTEQGEYPTWSPDGSQLAFSTTQGGKEIYRVRLDGSGLTRLTDAPGEDWHADWSPDGQQIAFSSQRGSEQGDVYVMNADGSQQRRLGEQHGFGPAWSPNGRQIVYAAGGGLYVMNADGAQIVPVPLTGIGEAELPDWSADATGGQG